MPAASAVLKWSAQVLLFGGMLIGWHAGGVVGAAATFAAFVGGAAAAVSVVLDDD